MKYEPVIGLEVHVELNTKSKMFCRCFADYFSKEPNTHTCPICLGLPGALPYTNKEAITKCIQIGLALNCKIVDLSRFERKNYFYPDLPKGYQISQYRWPLCVEGWLEVEDKEGNVSKIRINRVHQEEDTGKLTHSDGQTLIDFNRSGVPLVDIATEPDFTDPSQVKDYAKKLQQIFRYLSVSNADMEKGDMRLEANVSVRPVGQKELPNYRVELKNINSFRFMTAAIEYEIKRQIEALEKGEKLTQETRGWNEDKRETYLQRSKEEAHDYRYFPEPDLPELKMKSEEERVKEEMVELPQAKMQRFVSEYGISKQNAQVLVELKEVGYYFEKAVKLGEAQQIKPQELANYIVNQKITLASQDQVLRAVEFIAAKRVGIIEDEAVIKKIVLEVIKKNPKSVEDYKRGKLNALQALIGGVMRKTQGKVNVEKVMVVLEKKLKSGDTP